MRNIIDTDSVSVQKADRRCINDLVELLDELFSIEKDFIFNRKKQIQGLKKLIDSPHGHLLAAFHKGRAIGMCTLQVLISTAEGGNTGLVEDMIVLEPYRKKGIGKKLLTEIENIARKMGLSRLQLLADRNNYPALDFYKKTGWSLTQLICLRKK